MFLLLLMFLWLVLVGWPAVGDGDINVVVRELMFQSIMIFLSTLVLELRLMFFCVDAFKSF